MNNLTKIAALPTGGGCQSALRPEDRGAERKPAPELQPLQIGMLRALIGKSVTREFIRDVLGGHSGFATGGIVGKVPDQMLMDIAEDGYVMCHSTRRFETITAPAQPGDQVEAVSVEPGEGQCLGVWPTLTLNFGGPPDDTGARKVWPEKCRVTFKAEGAVDVRTQSQIADSVRRANLKGGAA